MNTLPEETLAVAKSYLGIRELTGNNDGIFVEKLQTWMDGGNGWMKGAPWCATFASYCIDQAAIQLKLTHLLPKLAASSDIYSWFLVHGLLLQTPVPNSIGLLKGDGGTPGKTHYHTFFVEGIDGDFISGIDGNWLNAVSRSRHRIADCDFGPII